MNEKLTVNCPNCKKSVVWHDKSRYRPFCSQRCQLVDFIDWADEKNRIAGESVIEHDATMTDDDSYSLE